MFQYSSTILYVHFGNSREGKSDMFQCSSTILYVHFRNSREGKSTSGVGNPCAPHPLSKSLTVCIRTQCMYRYTCTVEPPIVDL